MDPFEWLDAIFGGSGGSGAGSVQGSAPVNQGFAPFIGWANSQAFNDAGPLGQYFGMVFGSPGSGIPTVSDVTHVVDVNSPFDQRGGDWGTYQRTDFTDFTPQQTFSPGTEYSRGESDNLSSNETIPPPGEPRTLEVLDREESSALFMPSAGIDEVKVIGSPRDQATPHTWWPGYEAYLASQKKEPMRAGGEIQLNIDIPLPSRPQKPRRPATRKSSSADAVAPAEPKPEREQIDTGPYFNVDQAPSTVTGQGSPGAPWMSDAPVPEQFLPFGSWNRPENTSPPRLEMQDTSRGSTDRMASLPSIPMERSFWSRGGTGLAFGALTASLGVAAVMWWNPVGWAAIGAALAIAAGSAATIASGVEVSASYAGATSPEQDARMNEAVSATLGYSSPGGVIGSVLGTVIADDAQQGFQKGAMWGGLIEGAASLPATLRSIPGIWNAARPWAKSLLISPLWFFTSAGGGGGSLRSMARIFSPRGRMASRVRQVEYLGLTPLNVRNADWARYQVFATRSSNESVFRITYTNGAQRIVLADRWQQTNRLFIEAKFGNMGQMYIPAREAHIMGQVQNYLDIATITGGSVRYVVSTELGASRLTQRFGLDFPEAMASDMLTIDWVQWRH